MPRLVPKEVEEIAYAVAEGLSEYFRLVILLQFLFEYVELIYSQRALNHDGSHPNERSMDD
jgi:hypothetical protein